MNKNIITPPLVSVIVPTKDRPQLLESAIVSINNQTYNNIEIIVINDGGIDVSGVIASAKKKFNLHYINHEKSFGPAAARNCGIKKATGKYIAYLDDDDIFYPNHVETLVSFLENNNCYFAYSDSIQIFQGLNRETHKKLVKNNFDKQRLLVMNYIPTLNIVHRKECVDQVGLFNEDLHTHEDWDLWIRISGKYDIFHVEEVTAEFKTYAAPVSITSSRRADFLKTMELIHAKYAYLINNPKIINDQKFVRDELAKEILAKEKYLLKPGRLVTEKSKDGDISLKIQMPDDTFKTIHSRYSPVAEAKSMVDNFLFDEKSILVVLGLGLGYHITELLKKFPKANIIILEAMPEIYTLAKTHGKLDEFEKQVKFIVGFSPEGAIREITRYQIKTGMLPLKVFPLPSIISAFSEYYQSIQNTLNNTISVKIWDKLKYPKFKNNKLKVAIIDFDYFLTVEVKKAFKGLGHQVVNVPVKKSDDGEIIVERLLKIIIELAPDFFITLNHLGFDEEGVLTDFFKSINMPVASWYVDSPNLIVKGFEKNVSPYTAIFLWDKSYIYEMRKMGFDNINYLPLATDPDVFKPINFKKKITPFLCDVGFVGNSMVGPLEKKMAAVKNNLHPLIDILSAEFIISRNTFEIILNKLSPTDKKIIENLDRQEKIDFEAAILWKATLQYRLSCLKTLKNFNIRVYGDDGWKFLLDTNYEIFPCLNYYKELPYLYNACKINLNATNLQMGEAVNQRVFDVPACGSFLLTDHQEAIETLFEVGKEIITYKNKVELPELVRYYLKNSGAREIIVQRGRERVLKEHTYQHRVNSIIQLMKSIYG